MVSEKITMSIGVSKTILTNNKIKDEYASNLFTLFDQIDLFWEREFFDPI